MAEPIQPSDTLTETQLSLHKGDVADATARVTEALETADFQQRFDLILLLSSCELLSGHFSESRARVEALAEELAATEGTGDDRFFTNISRMGVALGLAAWAEALTGPVDSRANRLESIKEMLIKLRGDLIDTPHEDPDLTLHLYPPVGAVEGLATSHLNGSMGIDSIESALNWCEPGDNQQYVAISLAYIGRLIGVYRPFIGLHDQDAISAAITDCSSRIEEHDQQGNWRVLRAALSQLNLEFMRITQLHSESVDLAETQATESLARVDESGRETVVTLCKLLTRKNISES